MRKFSFLALTAFAIAMLGSSCEKCVTCEYDVLGTTVSDEFCSSDGDERDAFEAASEIAAQLVGTTADCTTD